MKSSSVVVASPPSSSAQHAPWHSPVPYLFGGLTAMLGLIAFALLILACSYWKLSGYLENGNGTSAEEERDIEAGDESSKGEVKVPVSAFEQKFLVIMAGQEKPTFLATPAISSSRIASSFGTIGTSNSTELSNNTGQKSDKSKEAEKMKEERGIGVSQMEMVSRD